MTGRVLALAVLAGCLAAGCKDPVVTQVMVTVDADPEIRRVARRLEFRVYGGERTMDGIPNEGMEFVRFPIEAGDIPWPVTIALAPRAEDDDRQYRVVVTALDARGAFVAEVKAISGYTRGKTLWLRLYIDRFCLYVDDCVDDADLTCAGGMCVGARTPEDRLPDFGDDAGTPMVVCESAADCDDGVACTTDDCVAARCTATPDDTACTDGPDGVCDPMNGCQYSVCDEATTCLPGDCQTARCEGTTCVRTSTCTGDEVCCGGACMSCDDGNDCTDDGCDGTSCTHAPLDMQPCEDDRYCNGSEVCMGSTCAPGTNPCVAPLTCDEAAASCVNCTSDADCTDDVMMGSCVASMGAPVCSMAGTRTVTTVDRSCVSGTCVADAPTMSMESCTRPTDGTTCNDGMFCNGPDRCMGGACAPGSTSPCSVGQICIESSDSCTTPMLDGGPRDAGFDGCIDGVEICDNGINDDCNPAVDCADPMCTGVPECIPDGGFDGCVDGAEICDNGVNDDCNPAIDCADPMCTGAFECMDAGGGDSGLMMMTGDSGLP